MPCNRETGVWAEAGKTFDTREVKAQSGRSDLHSESRFRLRFGSEWTIAGARVGSSVNFARNAELFIETKDAGDSVSQNVVLREQLGRRRENGNPKISESIEAAVLTKLLTDQDRSKRVGLIQADAACFV